MEWNKKWKNNERVRANCINTEANSFGSRPILAPHNQQNDTDASVSAGYKIG